MAKRPASPSPVVPIDPIQAAAPTCAACGARMALGQLVPGHGALWTCSSCHATVTQMMGTVLRAPLPGGAQAAPIA